MADDYGIYDVAGQLQVAVSQTLGTALEEPLGHINFRREPERLARDNAEAATLTNLPYVHVAHELSSSHHEVQNLNAMLSGTEALEHSPVPASGNLYYSKRQRFQKVTYKVTGSLFLSEGGTTGLLSPSTAEGVARQYGLSGSFDPISGAFREASPWDPVSINFDVAEKGKIVDVKVWVEFIHDIRGGYGSSSFFGNPFWRNDPPDTITGSVAGGYTRDNPKHGLQAVQLALRSPNVHFEYSHPLWNDPTVKNFEKWPNAPSDTSIPSPAVARTVPEILRNSYLLWAGHACEDDLGQTLGGLTSSYSDSNFTINQLDWSQMGPGISGSEGDFSGGPETYPSYAASSTFNPSFRTLSTISMEGGKVGVLFPRWNDRGPSLVWSEMMFRVDSGSGPSSWSGIPDTNYQVLYSASYSVTSPPLANAGGPRTNSPRLRAQKNSPYMHAAALGGQIFVPSGELSNPVNSQVGVVYGIRHVGDPALYGWCLKSPTLYSTKYFHEEFVTFADSFFDFCLDSNGKPHFVANRWRPDLGVSILTYTMLTGSTANLSAAIPDATNFVTSSYGLPKYFDYFIAPSGGAHWPDRITGDLDNPLLNDVGDGQDIASAGNVGAFCKIECDSQDRLHVVYTDTSNHTVKYATKQVAYTPWTGSWEFESVFMHTGTVSWPTYLSLELDDSDNPHVAYSLYDSSLNTDNLFYARRETSGSWTLEKVATIPGLKTGVCIKFDNEGVPVITSAVHDWDGNQSGSVLLFRSSSLAGWTQRALYYDKLDQPRDSAIAFDNQNKVRVYTAGEQLMAIKESGSRNNAMYFEYDRDIDMRTIFTDSSRNMNPRNMSTLYSNARVGNSGESTLPGLLFLQQGAYPSPFSASLGFLRTPGVMSVSGSKTLTPTLDHTAHLTGSNIPWMIDDRVKAGFLHPLNYRPYVTAAFGLSPPPGWLTGPGGTPAINEWPTTGANLGPPDIQPVYPLLDDVYVEKVIPLDSLTSNATILSPSALSKKLIGFRPGLRGTQSQGKWSLLLATGAPYRDPDLFAFLEPRYGVWFRQARLELTIDVGEEPTNRSYPSKDRRFKNYANVTSRGSRRLIQVMSGSSSWDIGTNCVYVDQPPQYGRSVGITDSTGSAADSFAVFSRITGSLADLLTSQSASMNFYLTNEFGTPFIPLSSGSANDVSFESYDPVESRITRKIFNDVLRPTTLVPAANTLKSVISRADFAVSTRDAIDDKVSALTGSS